MLFDYLIVHIALKLAEIDRIEGIEKLATFAPPPLPEYTAKNTARSLVKLNLFSRLAPQEEIFPIL